MQGEERRQRSMLMVINVEERVPQEHPLTRVKQLAEAISRSCRRSSILLASRNRIAPDTPPDNQSTSYFKTLEVRGFTDDKSANGIFRWLHRQRMYPVLPGLGPGQLILYRDDTWRAGRYARGALCGFSRLHYAAQLDLAVIAIDRNRGIIGNSVVSQRALDLGYQKGIVGAVGRGLVVVMSLELHTVVLRRNGSRFP
jgi:hypothetical protein